MHRFLQSLYPELLKKAGVHEASFSFSNLFYIIFSKPQLPEPFEWTYKGFKRPVGRANVAE
ncbi:hypothetical protein EBQ74_00945, partial [bacterium]|nr:hypothetical protein [bacterium]